MDTLKVLDLIVSLVVIALLIYVIIVITPQDVKLLKECNEKILCVNGMLKGNICDKYKTVVTIPLI